MLSLIRGCDYQGMMPYAPALLIQDQNDQINNQDSGQSLNSSAEKDSAESATNKKFVQVIGFVQKRWM